MSFTKVAPAGIGTEPGDGYRIGNSFLHATGLDVSGIITATEGGTVTYFGDGSNLEGVSSSGIGTALSDDDTSSLNKIYYANQELSIGSTVTVNHPDTGIAAYTHYQDLVVKDNADFIVADGDTFIPDVLGINTSSLPNPVSGATGGRIRAGTITNAGANGAVNFPNGLTGTAGTFTGSVTANTYIGDGSGLTGIVGSGSGIVVKHDGSTVGTAGTINFSRNLDVSPIHAGIVTVTASPIHPEDFGAIAKPVLEAETRTWYNAMGTKPKREHLRSMDMLVKRLKWTNIWNELDTLYVFASHNKADSLLNVKNPTGIATLTETSTAIFTAGKGFTAGNNGRLATTVNFNTFSTQYTLNAAHIGVFMLDEGQRDDSPIAGVADGNEDGYIIPHRASTNEMRGRVSTSSGNDFPNDNSSGSFIITRNSATDLVAYRNGFQLGTASRSAEAVPTDKLEVLNITGNDGSGTIGFLHTGDKLYESQARSLAWMMQEYINEVEQGYDEGATVTTSMLDATVNISNNTTAMQNFLNSAVGTTLGLLGDETYLVNDQLSIPDSPNIQGVIGKSTIRADASGMNNEKALIIQGSKDNQSFGGRIDGLIVDYNMERTSTTGGREESSDGDAFALHNVQGGRYTNITCMSARKHGFDILGNTYNRSGTDYNFNQRHNLTSRNIYVDQIKCMGNGDDQFTTHGAEYITVGYVHGEFSRSSFGTSDKNSNGIEIDDLSRYITIKNASARFVHKAVEIKGHDDALAAEHVYIGRISGEHCNRALEIRHIGHGSSTISPSAGDVIIDNVHYSKPLPYHGNITSTESITGTGVDNSGSGLAVQAAFIYSYDRVQIGNFTARAEGAENVCQGQILEISGGGTNFFCNRVEISNFSSATEGIQFRNGTTGYSMFGSVRIHNTGTDHGIEIDSGTDVIIASYAIDKTFSTSSGKGIEGNSGTKLGAGTVNGYGTATDLS